MAPVVGHEVSCLREILASCVCVCVCGGGGWEKGDKE